MSMSEEVSAEVGPHANQPMLTQGEPLPSAHAAALFVHGRGAQAEDILTLAEQLAVPGFAYLAPQAAQNTWYPNRFTAPLSANEPWLSSALGFLNRALGQMVDAGIPGERIVVIGFSQGACLALEFAARHARRYGALVGLSGGLIGPDDAPRDYRGSLAGTPVFLGCSDVDPHIPKERVLHAASVLQQLGGQVTTNLYAGLGHSANQDEIDVVRGLMQATLAS